MPTSRFRAAFIAIVAVCLGTAWAVADSQPNKAGMTAPHPWSSLFSAPTEISTDRVYLEPLTPDHTVMDFAAVKSSSDHLRETLQWGNWPPADMTVDDNRFALEKHWAEFENHEAYAYTVLAPDKQSCLGCVYLNPSNQGEAGLSVIFWIRADRIAVDLDIHVVETLIAHIRDAWPVDFVEFPIPVQNQRGLEILKKIGLETGKQSERETTYIWRRSTE